MTGDQRAAETEPFTEKMRRDFLQANLAAARTSLLVYHVDGAEVVSLEPGATYVIGRESPATIRIADRSLSRQHAQIRVESNAIWLVDLESTNGTFVNGERIDQREIHLGDRVMLGAVIVMLHVLQAVDGPPAPLEGHDLFMQRLEDEGARAIHFHRRFALLMIRAVPGENSHVSFWVNRVHRHLCPIDSVGMYAPSCIEILMPEISRQHGADVARQIQKRCEDVELVSAVGIFPDDATTIETLAAQLREAVVDGEAGAVVSLATADYTKDAAGKGSDQDVIAEGDAMRRVYEQAKRVARSNLPVLILGETGVGKELMAQYLHAHSDRADGRLRAVNCAAIPSELVESTLFGHERGAFTGATERRIGVLESASGGTVFLDELGELSLDAQAALLRVLDTKRITRVGASTELEVDVRIVAATNRDLEAMCGDGTFRKDLFYRVNTVTLDIPPLRERREEVHTLAQKFVDGAARALDCEVPEITRGAMAVLERHAWPGNVRELRNVIDRAVVMSQDGRITVEDLPDRIRRHAPETHGLETTAAGANVRDIDFKKRIRKYEGQLILEALRGCAWNQTRAAEHLGIPRRTLVHKMKTLKITKLGFGGGDEG